MKLLNSAIRKGEARIQVENLDDLWYLSQIIDSGDIVKGETFRKIKQQNEDIRAKAAAKKRVFLGIKVEEVEFHKYSNALRVSGKIIEGLDDISKGNYHTFNIEENTKFTIIKEHWLKYQQDRIKEAVKGNTSKILICVFDREESYLALTKKYGYDLLTTLKGDVSKKDIETKTKSSFYSDIIKLLEEYSERYKVQNIVLASVSFFKEDLMKLIKNDVLKKKIVLATCSSVSENAINEVLRRQEVQHVLKQDRISNELKFVEQLLSEISTDGKAVYGLRDVKGAVDSGATNSILISDDYIQKMRKENKFDKVEKILKNADSMKAEIHIISSEHEGGKKLDGLGGIAALLRYKLTY